VNRSKAQGMNQHSKQPRPRRTKAELERARRKSEAARRYHLKKTHGMTPEEYASLKAWQNGTCWGCGRATGKTKNLAIDHDHKKCSHHTHNRSCPECWRGLLCGSCNDVLAHARDSVAFFRRMIDYLQDPPAQRWRRGHVRGD
jgi:Recombination endonuclease VII